MSDDPLKGVRLKIDHAKKRLEELETEVSSFVNRKPCRISIKSDIATRRLVYFVESVDEVPDNFLLLTADVIHNLRTALDHLAVQLVNRGILSADHKNKIYFPIFENCDKFQKNHQKSVVGMSKKAVKIIEELELYGGGQGNDFWVLHKLNNDDKHNFLLSIAVHQTGLNIGPIANAVMKKLMDEHDIPQFKDFYLRPENPKPAQPGDVLFTDAPEADIMNDPVFQFEILLIISDELGSTPLIPLLHRLALLIKSTVSQLEECL